MEHEIFENDLGRLFSRLSVHLSQEGPFLDALDGLLFELGPAFGAGSDAEAEIKLSDHLSEYDLKRFFDSAFEIISDSNFGVEGLDPWRVAKLGFDEVRNTSVLAWMLNPRGSHSLGALAIYSFLSLTTEAIPLTNVDFKRIKVRTEQYLDVGSNRNRADIIIECPQFFLVVEVKVRHVEGDSQLARYGEFADQRAGNRPWAMAYLSVSGSPAETAGSWNQKVVNISWRDLAGSIATQLRRHRSQSDGSFDSLLANWLFETFLNHVSKFKSK